MILIALLSLCKMNTNLSLQPMQDKTPSTLIHMIMTRTIAVMAPSILKGVAERTWLQSILKSMTCTMGMLEDRGSIKLAGELVRNPLSTDHLILLPPNPHL